MTLTASASASAAVRTTPLPSLSLAAVLLGTLTIVRYIGLYYSSVDLFFDESQYWSWSRDLAFGYFSKPPLLAWIIAGSSAICGDGEACVRAASPLLYFGTSLLVYAVADTLYDARTAFWSALTFALVPAMVFSTRIISTDVPLLFCWALALLAYVKLRRGADWRWALVLGSALGLGLLAKYAMAYFFAAIAIAALFDHDTRALLKRPRSWVAGALALLILLPNVLWNISNGFVTLRHTGDNIQGNSGLHFSPAGALEFIAAQFGVIGPLLFGGFLVLLVRAVSSAMRREDQLMLLFALPLAIVTMLGFFRGVNANWAVPAIVSVVVVVVAVWVRQDRFRLLAATLVLGLIVQIGLLAGDAVAYRAGFSPLGPKGDLYRRTLGWRGLGDAARVRAQDTGAKTVVAESRYEIASLVYYLRTAPQPVLSWPATGVPNNHFDMTSALQASAAEPILFISACMSEPRLAKHFGQVKPLGAFSIPSGPTSSRNYHAFLLSGARGPITPLGGCPG